ncbi:MAG: hypothetical protein RSF68_02265 [Myroides sp.]|uniref:Uncharacterized protein n=1 Tax=Paenimyroides baculatum TaxID=2608000 RepID=A0A5M6CL96_9FLAO|nr:hypothetical protein [Paenimyroides baculatum]KAA5535767.1 hypothetical protein F0460_04835 [Paenimyroides baculatum]
MVKYPKREVLKITDWNKVAAGLQRQFPILILTDIDYIKGKEKDFLERISRRLNKYESEMISIINRYQL